MILSWPIVHTLLGHPSCAAHKSTALRRFCSLAILLLVGTAKPATAAEKSESSIDWKLSIARYSDSEAGSATDVNLRGSHGSTTFWLGHYDTLGAGDGFRQARMGIEQNIATGLGRIVPGLQIAGGGFVNYSLTLEVGNAMIKPIVGVSRTNEKRFFNINFDPNDSVQFGAAVDLPDGRRLLGYAVRDDRISVGQQITHFVYREPFQGGRRLVFDVFHRSGPTDDPRYRISAWGSSLTFDLAPYSIRLVYDPKVNFTLSNMWRLTAAYRF